MSVRRRRGESTTNAPAQELGYAGRMPLYALGVNNRGVAVAGGGGGASKTGIPNGLIFFKYNSEKIEKIGEHHTNVDAITSLDIHPEENVAIYVDTDKFAKVQFASGGTVLKTETFSNSMAKNVKVMRFSPDASKVAVGCYDGPLAVLSYPAMTTTGQQQQAHTDDVDDVSWDPSGKFLATTSKDCTAKVWRTGTGTGTALQTVHTLVCEAEGKKLVPRGCRFSPNSNSNSPAQLFVSAFVVSKASYVFVWNVETAELIRKAKIHNSHSSSFAMSPNGAYVAVGDTEGTIVVAETNTLNKILQVKPHNFIVSGLAFVPSIKSTSVASVTRKRGSRASLKQTTGKQETEKGALISIGADYACMFTPIVPQSFANKQQIVILVGILVVLLAILLRYVLI